jgi:hypothetical protein
MATAKQQLGDFGDLSIEISAQICQLSPEQFKSFKSLYIANQTTNIFGTLQSVKNKMFS